MKRNSKGFAASAASRHGRRFTSCMLMLALGLFALLTLAGPALAETTVARPLLFSIDGSKTPQGKFSEYLRFGVAVDESSGNIYLNDAGYGTVDAFDSSGAFLFQTDGSGNPSGKLYLNYGIAVDNSGGPGNSNVYVSNYRDDASNGIYAFDSTGAFLYQIESISPRREGEVLGLTVTDDGYLLAQVTGSTYSLKGKLLKYSLAAGSATLVSQLENDAFNGVGIGVGADLSGNFYFANPQKNAIEKRDISSGALLQTVAASRPENPALDRASGTIFATEGQSVSEYSAAGVPQGRFGGNLANGAGIAVDEATDRVIVVDQGKAEIHVYGPPESLTVPDVSLGSTTSDYFTAEASGQINPQGAPGAYRFEYRVHDTVAWKTTALLDAGEGSSNVAVEATLPNLIQNTEYDLRMVGVATESGAISTSPIQTFKTIAVPPPSISAPTAVESDSATFHGAVDPHGVKTGWHFEYSTNGSEWTKVPATDQDPGTGDGEVPVSTTATGLDPNTSYQVRLVATYLNGEGGSVTSSQVGFTTNPEKPVITLPSPADVLDTSATIQAAIDPRHAPTTYYFRFGTDESYGQTLPATEDGDAGSQLGPGRVSAELSDLEPNTTYHFQLIATNAAGTSETKDISFTTRTTAELQWPSRGYEMVNTPDKGNQAVFPSSKLEPWTSVSSDGNRVMWMTANGGPDSSTGATSTFIADYSPSGWSSHTVLPPASELPGEGNNWFAAPVSLTSDLSRSILLSFGGILGAHTAKTLVGVDDARNSTALLSLPADNDGSRFLDGGVAEAVSGGRVVVGGGSAVPAGPYPLTLYEADGHAEGLPVPSCGYAQIDSTRTWVSSDASRIFVYSAGDSDCKAPRGIFAAEPGSAAAILVSGTQSAPATFIRAERDGTALLFSKEGDLYRWSEGEGEECLSCGSGYEIAGGTASPDLSHLYFCGPLPPGSPKGVGCSIYVWRASGIQFVANKSDVIGAAYSSYPPPLQTDEHGDQLIFISVIPYVTSADDTDWNGNLDSSNPTLGAQIYHYDDTSGIVECVSCTEPAKGSLPPPEGALVSNRPTISADGQTIAFTTNAKLRPEDINGRYDVYEWHNGLTRLITDGESEFESSLSGTPRVWGLSPDGRSLFFSAGGAAITGNEVDTIGNVYDARVGSAGFPPPPPPARCSEDSCQGSLQAAPALAGTASASFTGPGNASQAEARKKKKAKKRRHAHKAKGQTKKGKGQGREAKANHKRGGAK